MTDETIIAMVSIIAAAATMAIGAIGAAFGESRIGVSAMDALARQPDESGSITRTLFVSLAMVEQALLERFDFAQSTIDDFAVHRDVVFIDAAEYTGDSKAEARIKEIGREASVATRTYPVTLRTCGYRYSCGSPTWPPG